MNEINRIKLRCQENYKAANRKPAGVKRSETPVRWY